MIIQIHNSPSAITHGKYRQNLDSVRCCDQTTIRKGRNVGDAFLRSFVHQYNNKIHRVYVMEVCLLKSRAKWHQRRRWRWCWLADFARSVKQINNRSLVTSNLISRQSAVLICCSAVVWWCLRLITFMANFIGMFP